MLSPWDTLELLETRWREIAQPLGERFPQSELGSVAPEELSAVPGIQEVLGLHEVGELAASGRWDHIVVDCASTADALRMLTLPSTFGLYLERAWPRHRRLSTGADGPSLAIVDLIERITAGVEQLSTLLTDGTAVSAHLVLTAERVVAAEAVRTLGALALMGVSVNQLIVNQVLVQDDSYEYRNLPDHPAFDWYAERIAEQRTVLDELASTIGDVELVLGSAPGLRTDRRKGAASAARPRHPQGRVAATGAVAAGRRSGVRVGAGIGLSDAATVAPGRCWLTDSGSRSTMT